MLTKYGILVTRLKVVCKCEYVENSDVVAKRIPSLIYKVLGMENSSMIVKS